MSSLAENSLPARSPVRVLLGPQSPVPNIVDAVANAGMKDGSFAVISAAWQETEGDIDEVRAVLGRDLEDLQLYRRADELLAGNAELDAASRLRQDRLIEQQKVYRLRLKQLNIAARLVLGAEGDAEMIAAEQRHAVAQLRALDRHHLHRTESVWRSFNDKWSPDRFPEIARHTREIAEILQRSSGVLITGGNVAVLINRLRLFGVDRLLDNCNIVAWSAGAMALTERIVLYHDHSPGGRRDAEVLGSGCGVVPGYVLLPDAKHRLRQQDRKRISLLSRRFSPDSCVTLDRGAELHTTDTGVAHAHDVRELGIDGRLARLRKS